MHVKQGSDAPYEWATRSTQSLKQLLYLNPYNYKYQKRREMEF